MLRLRVGVLGALVSTVSIHALVLSSAVRAQEAPSVALRAASRTFDFHLDEQSLKTALTKFSKVTGFDVVAHGTVTQKLRAPAVSGRMSAKQALDLLLWGTKVEYRFTNTTTVILTTPEAITARAQAITLDTISVEGKHNPNAVLGNLPPPYAGGQVASGGQVGLLGNKNFMDTPFNQTNYTSKLIQDQQARTIADVLVNDPSVRNEFPAGSGIDQFTIRGFLAGNQDIAFGGLYGIAPTSNGSMAAESIERVEVLKGPNALLNGMAPFGTIAGLINIVPKRAGDEPITQFTPSYYSNEQLGGHFDVGRRYGPNGSFGIRFNGVYRNGDTAIDRQSQETRVTALGLDFRGESVRLSADLGYQFINTNAPRQPLTVAAGLPVPAAPGGSSNYVQPWTFQQNENAYGALRGEVDIASNLTAFAAVGGSIFQLKSLIQSPVVTDTLGTITASPTAVRMREDTATAEVGLRGFAETGFVRHEFVLTNTMFWKDTGVAFQEGASITSNLYDPRLEAQPAFWGLPSPADTPRMSDQNLSSLAFADTLSVLDKRIQLTLGVRRQQIKVSNFDLMTGSRTSSYDESAVTPAVGLIIRPVEYLSFYGNYIQGLSQGPTAPLGTENAGEIFPPFITEQYELGAKIDFGRIALTLSAFQITQPSAFTNPATNIFSVDGEQRNRGVELTTFGEITDGIRLLGGVTLMESELVRTANGVNQGNDGIGVPLVQANLGGEWDVPSLSGFTLLARGIYTSSQYLNTANTQVVPSWTRLDLGARYVIKTGDKPIVVRANIENVFNTNYWATASRGFLGLGAPRTFLLSTTFSF